MNIQDFATQMQSLLDMQKDYQRIKSENLLLRQRIDDLNKTISDLKRDHEVEKHKFLLGYVEPQKLAEARIDQLIDILQDWNESLWGADYEDMQRSNCCDSSYYERERDLMDEKRSQRHEIINQIQAILEKSAGIGD